MAVAAFCWSATIDGQLTEHPGNLTLVVESATKPKATLGDEVGWHAIVHAVGIVPWWLQTPKSRWQRKYEVRSTPSTLATNSTIAMLAALVRVALIALVRRRRDVATLALTALVMCPALGSVAASTPTPRRLSATLGYTMWWGSQAGMVVWLALAWVLALVLAWAVRKAVRRMPHPTGRPAALGPVLLTLVGIGGAAAVGNAVAAQATPDEHATLYHPIKTIDARLARLVPRGGSVVLRACWTEPPNPSNRRCATFSSRAAPACWPPGRRCGWAPGMSSTNAPYREAVYLGDVPHSPVKHVPLAFDVGFREGAKVNTVYVWISHRPGR